MGEVRGVSGRDESSEWVEEVLLDARCIVLLCPIGQSSATSLHAVLSYRSEPQIFKARFKSWDDVLAVDFTCTPEMLEKRKMELVCFHGVCLGLSVSLPVSLPVWMSA